MQPLLLNTPHQPQASRPGAWLLLDCSFRTRGWYSICRVSGVRFLIFVCDWGNWPYPFAGQLGQLLPNVRPASPLLVHELLSGPYGSPFHPYTSSAVAGLVAFSHSSARSPHPCDHFCSTSRLFCFCMLYSVVCSRFLGQPRSSYTASHPTALVRSHPVHFQPMSLRSLCLLCLSFQRSEQSAPLLGLASASIPVFQLVSYSVLVRPQLELLFQFAMSHGYLPHF